MRNQANKIDLKLAFAFFLHSVGVHLGHAAARSPRHSRRTDAAGRQQRKHTTTTARGAASELDRRGCHRAHRPGSGPCATSGCGVPQQRELLQPLQQLGRHPGVSAKGPRVDARPPVRGLGFSVRCPSTFWDAELGRGCRGGRGRRRRGCARGRGRASFEDGTRATQASSHGWLHAR